MVVPPYPGRTVLRMYSTTKLVLARVVLFRVVIHNVIVETEDVLGCP